MPKNIVICCDGTGNEYGDENSNVVKLYWTLSGDQKQTSYYHPGVGTMGARDALTLLGKWWTEVARPSLRLRILRQHRRRLFVPDAGVHSRRPDLTSSASVAGPTQLARSAALLHMCRIAHRGK